MEGVLWGGLRRRRRRSRWVRFPGGHCGRQLLARHVHAVRPQSRAVLRPRALLRVVKRAPLRLCPPARKVVLGERPHARRVRLEVAEQPLKELIVIDEATCLGLGVG